MPIATSTVIGDSNKNLILQAIRENGPVSRADISRMLKISKPAISKNVKELLDAHIIKEIGQGNNDTGRKSTLLMFNAVKAYVVGADIGNFKIRVGIADLSGEFVELKEAQIGLEQDGEKIIHHLETMILEIIEQRNISPKDILALCIGIPGVKDEQSKRNRLTPFIHNWENMDIAGYFIQKHPHLKVIIKNNINLAALGEYKNYGLKGKKPKNVAYINFGIGIGAGIILNGKLYSGKNNTAGEIGFCSFKSLAADGNNRNTGSFEKTVSVNYWVPRYNAMVEKERQISTNSSDISSIFDRYDAGEQEARQVIDEIFENILMLFISISAILNIEVIIIGGGLGERMKPYFPRFEKIVKSNVPFAPQIKCARLGSISGVHGAISCAVADVMRDYKNLQ